MTDFGQINYGIYHVYIQKNIWNQDGNIIVKLPTYLNNNIYWRNNKFSNNLILCKESTGSSIYWKVCAYQTIIVKSELYWILTHIAKYKFSDIIRLYNITKDYKNR